MEDVRGNHMGMKHLGSEEKYSLEGRNEEMIQRIKLMKST
jgi:hypothetical protein